MRRRQVFHGSHFTGETVFKPQHSLLINYIKSPDYTVETYEHAREGCDDTAAHGSIPQFSYREICYSFV